ncbi:MAG: tRNA 5-methoxyuridine(34)/uridine 5-oxyacetic acid(34) synthase CmoB [Campylobacterales bacterium]|nr:tRNA 5-methoxyuridine(34)/uridine 5-oxyacetic acid(34) synthase CmoB [Campylobacterales bacterium]
MNIDQEIKKTQQWFQWKNIAPIKQQLQTFIESNISQLVCDVVLDDFVQIKTSQPLQQEQQQEIINMAKALMPWRKGPFKLFDLEIDSEWQSNKKYNLLRPFFDLKDKIVADVGCNNGYYMFRMLEDSPKKLVGFDPSPLFNMQFDFINSFVKSDIKFELLGYQHLPFYYHKFDFIFMLGVLYHRSDPIDTLKCLSKALNPKGEVIVDSFIIDGEDEVCLFPKDRYSKIANIYFIPTVNCFKNWLFRAGFVDIELLQITKTDSTEQRVTPWTFEQSLSDYLDPNNSELTVEGYSAPKRAYLKARKKN